MTAREMIEAPSKWPAWPALPLKHREKRDAEGMKLCGLLLDEGPLVSHSGWNVYLVNLFDLPLPGGWDAWDAKLYKSYASVEELVREWEVD